MTAVDETTLMPIERYYDAVPRASADVEEIGPLVLFVPRSGWPLYGRPRVDASAAVTTAHVTTLLERQRALGLPEVIEWLAEATPSLADATVGAGLTLSRHPLMVLDRDAFAPVPAPTDVVIRLLHADDPHFASAHAVAHVAFERPGTALGEEGPVERDLVASLTRAGSTELRRARTEAGLTRSAVALTGAGPVCIGSHQPVGDVTEVVGIGTLPFARRRGLAAAVTSALVTDAYDVGVRTVFLSASGPDVARVYARLGFRQVGTACVATPPDDSSTID